MAADNSTGPVEIAVLEFPGRGFDGEIVPALSELVDDGIVTILDLVLVCKDVDGSITSVELSDLGADTAALFDDLDGEVNGLLADEDLATVGEALSLGSSALLVVWETSWARRLVDAVAASGGRLVAHDRLDAETVRELLVELPSA
jgi:uncharacterized membrane protein